MKEAKEKAGGGGGGGEKSARGKEEGALSLSPQPPPFFPFDGRRLPRRLERH